MNSIFFLTANSDFYTIQGLVFFRIHVKSFFLFLGTEKMDTQVVNLPPEMPFVR